MNDVKGMCKVPECDGDEKSLGLCSACYSYFYYWHKKTPKALMARQTQIQRYNTRMDMMGAPVLLKRKVSAKLHLSAEQGNMPGTTMTKFKMKPSKIKRVKAA